MIRICPPLVSRWIGRRLEDCPCGKVHELTLRQVWLGPGLIENVPEMIASEGRGPLVLLADANTHDAAGARVAAGLRRNGWRVHETILEERPHADQAAIRRLQPALLDRPKRVVAVGSGTINDLGKVLAAEASVRLLTVGTAASMNGYVSPIAALTRGGLKITRAVPAPDLLLLDTEVLAAAPIRLTRAGFGDLCSKPVSGADWVLAQCLVDEPLCPTALSVADEAVARARAVAEGIGRQDPSAVAILAEALVLSGISMALAGGSSPASGGEHLISHYLDISEEGWNREAFLHGEQVAVGTRVSLALYRRLTALYPPAPGDEVPQDPDAGTLRRLHAHLGSETLEELLREAGAKASRSPGREARRTRLAQGWDELWGHLREQLKDHEQLEEDLRRAGVPRTFSDIEITRERAADLIRLARFMRNRYTVLDFAADLGRLDEWAEEIAEELS